ncbi:MAG: hypothetical protein JWN23_3460 [Rhodocyclales bacterium]|nr:hypothetical protein [Rhodocyclales bacterium]
MEVDPIELVQSSADSQKVTEARTSRLNAIVAITVAILATFMGVCKVKDDNIVQAMQQAQADKLDHWAYYQARTIRADVAQATSVQLTLQSQTAKNATGYKEAIAKYDALAKDQLAKREDMRKAAEQDQQKYDALNYHDDQFDLSDALLAIAIAMLAVTALTSMWALYWAALVPTGFGMLMGLAGLLGWAIHPDALTALLS